MFKKMQFISHSGIPLGWKIDCDALTNEDLDTLAKLVSTKIEFGEVIPIPRGGYRFAKALQKYVTKDPTILIVDDVLTTGKSMSDAHELICRARSHEINIIRGVVIFSRVMDVGSWIYQYLQLEDHGIHNPIFGII